MQKIRNFHFGRQIVLLSLAMLSMPVLVLASEKPSVMVDAFKGDVKLGGASISSGQTLPDGAKITLGDKSWASLFLTTECKRVFVKGGTSYTIAQGKVLQKGGVAVPGRALAICKDDVEQAQALASMMDEVGTVVVRGTEEQEFTCFMQSREEGPICGLPGEVSSEHPALGVRVPKGVAEVKVSLLDDNGKSLWTQAIASPGGFLRFSETKLAPASLYMLRIEGGGQLDQTFLRTVSKEERATLSALRNEMEGTGNSGKAPSLVYAHIVKDRGLYADLLQYCRDADLPAAGVSSAWDRVCRNNVPEALLK